MSWTTTRPIPAVFVRGALELETTHRGMLPHRLPAWARAQAGGDAQLLMVESQPSGVKIAFRTEATELELDTLRTRIMYRGAPPRPDGIIELLVNGDLVDSAVTHGGDATVIDMATGSMSQDQGPVCTSRFAQLRSGMKNIEIWLPHSEVTELVELRSNAEVEPPAPVSRPRWLHHGSSISHGSNATRPTAIWPAIAAKAGNVELTNLGFGGSALLDPFMARTMRDTPAQFISVKMGINLVNLDLMRRRALGPAVHGFLDTIREGHPETPLLVISPIFCGIHEETPGPGAFDMDALAAGSMQFVATGDPAEIAAGKLTLRVIRDELQKIVAQRAADDANLYYLDGLDLYGEADSGEHPLPDALHPDTATHQLIGERFASMAFGAGGPLS
ncbi:GDSL-like Lipase/Acylhydrolase family protein [Arthrobacter alpinus]|uniref:GDSL-like Lipase/Acylhydrolase family protein n=1 Tax=Arthrobacter alpinus TaxID=656366 RepID=A0A1H5ITI8_9MICC|nr:SGNH/GDSL hydrolase family protein [Arthrobacter alpinus]SEE43460.1 GDSL-like Lipase/Acylhydrolase family protein [Arthrobacter alpinus]